MTPGTTIYYTTDGTEPTASSAVYSGALGVSSATTIQAIAVAPNMTQSPVSAGAYFIIAPTGTGPAVSVVMTTDDRSQLMNPQPGVNFASATATGNVIDVDEKQTYQTVEGFGAAFTDTAAYLLNEVATPASRAVINDLFTRDGNGIGLSFMRNPMGASDLARSRYSYDDLPAGQTDSTLASFSVAHDQADIIPLILEARRLNPQLKIMANPWSPPGWMKTSGSMIGGSLLESMDDPFANYFVKYIQAYAAAGISTDYISLQNEPLYVPTDYPGMSMDAATQTAVLRDHVLPALAANSLATRVLVYDHNWDTPSYPQTVLADSTILGSPAVAGIAWHGYGGTAGAMSTLHNQFPLKGNFETEHSGGTWVANQVKADFEEITQVMRNWGRAYVKWSLAVDQNLGPHDGGCGTCTPIVTVNNPSGAATEAAEYYTLGHFSKFVLPGAVRIYSSNNEGVVSVAFVNPDGSRVLVAWNDSDSNRMVQVQWGAQSFGYVLPSLAGATFTWNGTQTGEYTVPADSRIQTSSFSSTAGLQDEVTSDMDGGYDVGYADDGDSAAFLNLDFGSGVTGVAARMACNPAGGNCGGTVEFRLDEIAGPLLATVTVPATGGWQNWQTVSGTVSGSATGVHNLYIVYKAPPGGGTTSLGNFIWFQFN
jgi:glucosylceramidase